MTQAVEQPASDYFSPVRTTRRRRTAVAVVIVAVAIAGTAVLLLGSTSVGPPPSAHADGSELARGSWCWSDGSDGVCEERDVQRDDLPVVAQNRQGDIEIAVGGSPLTAGASIHGAPVDVTLRGSKVLVDLPEGTAPGVLSLGVKWDAGDSEFLAWVVPGADD